MKKVQRAKLELMEGRRFILGREGHIYIDSSTASNHHAEIVIKGGKIYLRDLDSTNGTYLLKNKTLIRFEEGYVNRLQQIVIGGNTYIAQELLVIASDFVSTNNDKTRVDLSIKSDKSATRKK